MKYLITGANGQLGSEWVNHLTKSKKHFVAYSSDSLDITRRSDIQDALKLEKPDVLVNCAAYTSVDRAESDTDQAFLVNETGVRNLFESCSQTRTKLVHFSTDYVFSGSSEDRLRYPKGYPENAETDPINRYGSSKRAGELVLEESAMESDWLLIRVSWLCGSYGSNFVKTMLRISEEKSEVAVVRDQMGSPTYTFDVVEKTIQLVETGQNGIFHISSAGDISWAEFAEEIFKRSRRQTRVNHIPSDEYITVAKRPYFSLLSKEKIEELGLKSLDWKVGLDKLLAQIKTV
ncbi:MAG: dTDP-4-dehydrorhamnose reductase [Balneolaceae bacterium]